jgi:integrase
MKRPRTSRHHHDDDGTAGHSHSAPKQKKTGGIPNPNDVKGPGLWWDDGKKKVSGLCLRAYSGGAKSFLFNYRVNGRERRITIGSYPVWSKDAARERAKELRKIVDEGRDPAGEKRERREAPTVQDLIVRYEAEHLPTKRAKARRLDYLKKIVAYRETDEKQMLAEIGKRLGWHTKVADVHGGDIREVHKGISQARGPVRANRILAVCSKAFSLALVPEAGENKPWRDAAMGNPCKGIERNPEEERDRHFSKQELAAISDALAQYGEEARGPGLTSAPAAADCIRLIMLTGCRPSEAMLSRWEEFDAQPGYWIKPSAHVKRGKVHKLPLNPAAMELIERLRKRRKSGAAWVFPGQRAGEPLKQLRSVWHWVRDRAALGSDARIYDLRHTFATVGIGGGLSLPIIGKLLGHTQARTTQRYAHLADDPLREAAEKIGAVIAGAGKAGAEVVALKKG